MIRYNLYRLIRVFETREEVERTWLKRDTKIPQLKIYVDYIEQPNPVSWNGQETTPVRMVDETNCVSYLITPEYLTPNEHQDEDHKHE